MSKETVKQSLCLLIDESVGNGRLLNDWALKRAADKILDSQWLKDYVNDLMTTYYHPEFGLEWGEPDGNLYLIVRDATAHAWKEGYYSGYNDHRENRRADPDNATP